MFSMIKCLRARRGNVHRKQNCFRGDLLFKTHFAEFCVKSVCKTEPWNWAVSPDHKPLALSLYSLGYSYNIILASPIMWVDKLPHFTIIISTADYYFTTPIIVICIHDGQFFIGSSFLPHLTCFTLTQPTKENIARPILKETTDVTCL